MEQRSINDKGGHDLKSSYVRMKAKQNTSIIAGNVRPKSELNDNCRRKRQREPDWQSDLVIVRKDDNEYRWERSLTPAELRMGSKSRCVKGFTWEDLFHDYIEGFYTHNLVLYL